MQRLRHFTCSTLPLPFGLTLTDTMAAQGVRCAREKGKSRFQDCQISPENSDIYKAVKTNQIFFNVIGNKTTCCEICYRQITSPVVLRLLWVFLFHMETQ